MKRNKDLIKMKKVWLVVTQTEIGDEFLAFDSYDKAKEMLEIIGDDDPQEFCTYALEIYLNGDPVNNGCDCITLASIKNEK